MPITREHLTELHDQCENLEQVVRDVTARLHTAIDLIHALQHQIETFQRETLRSGRERGEQL